MKILIVSGAFYPINSPRAFRTTELVKELVRQGHEIKLYSPKIDFDYFEFYKKYKFVHVQYTAPRDFLSGSNNKLLHILGRILVYKMAYPNIKLLKILPKLLTIETTDYDLLITIAVPHQIHWSVGQLYKKGYKFAKMWIADCGDPFMLSKSINRKQPFYFKPLEKRWCKLCDYISVPTETSYLGYYPEFRHKIKVIPQAFRFEDIVLDKYIKHRIPTFAFSGGIIAGRRDIRPVIKLLESMTVDYRLYVFTKDQKFFEDFRNIVGNKIILSNYIPRLDLIKVLSTMDFLLNLENGTSVQTPSKLIDYALTHRPILSINSNDIDKGKIMQFLNGDYSNARLIDNIEQYNVKNVVKQFLELKNPIT